MLRVVRPGARHVFQRDGGIEAEAFGDCPEPFGTKGSLGVDVDGLALGATFPAGHLAGHTEGVAELGLARAEFAKLFSKGWFRKEIVALSEDCKTKIGWVGW